jgi:hypothetical protein
VAGVRVAGACVQGSARPARRAPSRSLDGAGSMRSSGTMPASSGRYHEP